MPSLNQVVAASALMGMAFAAPVAEKRGTGFSVTQVKNPKYNPSSPVAQHQLAVAKWQSRLNKNSAQVNQGSVTATPQPGDTEYLCPVSIGGNSFTLDFDTGSSDTWVLGPQVSGAGNHNTYSPGSSAQLQNGETWQIQYGDGSTASGDVYMDTINVGGTQVTQAIEQATQAASAFTSGAEDGLLGLAFDTINTVQPNKVQTFMDNAINDGLTALFTADLKPGQPGTYDFGYIDSSKYSGSITYTDVDNSQGFWGFTPDNSDAGIADTGTTLLYLSDNSCSSYYQNVNSAQYDQSQGLYTFDCSESLPDFQVSINGYTATVPGSDINMGDAGNGQCLGGIQPDDSIGQAIYGDVFLKSQFVVFDLGTNGSPRLGFAPKA